ncbi:MAG: uroporphyrinogen-III synthase, partial [Clostridia bacterium]|nr:uroporphyrinogen-III synthase [Clostridia bacterium]
NEINYDEIKIHDIAVNSRSPYKVNTDYITFASASGVQAFFECGYSVSEKTKIVCIGDITADTLKRFVADDFGIAKTSSSDGIVQLIKEIEHEKIQKTSLK